MSDNIKSHCPICGADIEEKEVIVKLFYRGKKEDILKQIHNINGVFSWQESS